jgi:sterol desaturase/sphingolipid hydroxylase (fatty acid hydroxylase superfamily)
MELHFEGMIAAMLAIFAVLLLGEWGISAWKKKGFYSGENTVLNLSLGLMQQTSGLIYNLIFLAAFAYVQQNWSVQQWTAMPEIPVGWPVLTLDTFPFFSVQWQHVFTWLLVLVLADFCLYWLHRFSHEVHIMWAGHIVHHSNTEYNYSVALRQSFIEGFYTWIFYLPLAFFGVPWELFVSAYTLSIIWQFFVHTRMVKRIGLLEKVLVGPAHHRVHHARNEHYLDKNYGGLFIVWDKMFGTFQEEVEEPEYGITVPLENGNLLWTNLHQHAHMLKLWRHADGWREKMQVVFGWPSFLPKSLSVWKLEGNARMAFTTQQAKKWYIYLSFILTAILALVWSNQVREQPYWLEMIGVLIFVGGSLSILSGLLEDKLWSNIAEITRLCLQLGIGLLMLTVFDNWLMGVFLVISATVLLSFTWYLAADYKALHPIKTNV